MSDKDLMHFIEHNMLLFGHALHYGGHKIHVGGGDNKTFILQDPTGKVLAMGTSLSDILHDIQNVAPLDDWHF